jgi:hypothetical protein
MRGDKTFFIFGIQEENYVLFGRFTGQFKYLITSCSSWQWCSAPCISIQIIMMLGVMFILCNGQCPQLFRVYYFRALCAVTEGASAIEALVYSECLYGAKLHTADYDISTLSTISHRHIGVDEDRHSGTYYWTHYPVFRYFLAHFDDFIRELYIVRSHVLDRAVIRRPLRKSKIFVLFVMRRLLFKMEATDRF